VPLAKPIRLTDGTFAKELFVPKGTNLTLALSTFNQDPELWGPSAALFNPACAVALFAL
jgi:hypothetical protein